LINTYDEWYGYENLRKHMDDYLAAVILSDLENSIGRFLETNSFNLLTIESMPLVDLGDKPGSYDSSSSESGQIFIVPKS
jgi:hypothetical protein